MRRVTFVSNYEGIASESASFTGVVRPQGPDVLRVNRLGERRASLREPFLVPAIAERHRDPVVQECVRRFVWLYGCRASLRRPHEDARGDLILPAFPELLMRPLKRSRGAEPQSPGPDFERRRSDRMEAIIRTLLAIMACTDWVSMKILDPSGGYLSVARLAELAQLPVREVQRSEQDGKVTRRRFRHTRTDRALQDLRTAEIICFSKQNRELLEDGRYISAGPALRKLAVGLFRKFGGKLLRIFEKKKKQLEDERAKRSPMTGDLRIAAIVRSVGRNLFTKVKSRLVPQHLIETVRAENRGWAYPEVLAEARRRLERGPPPEDPPPPEAVCPF